MLKLIILTPIFRTCLVSRPIPRVHKTLGEMDITNENKEVHFLDESLSVPARRVRRVSRRTARPSWLVPVGINAFSGLQILITVALF